MIISFIISTYEYNNVHNQYVNAYNMANANLGKKPQQSIDHQVAEATKNASVVNSTGLKFNSSSFIESIEAQGQYI